MDEIGSVGVLLYFNSHRNLGIRNFRENTLLEPDLPIRQGSTVNRPSKRFGSIKRPKCIVNPVEHDDF